MSDLLPTEEEKKQVSRILRYWRIYSFFFLGILGYMGVEYTKKRFAKKLTANEYDMLVKVGRIASNRFERNAARDLTKVYRHINPQAEYLRASEKSEDETLLRAATSTETTPQNQLLRPSQNDSTP